MHVDGIRAFCLSFPQATENLQWGEDLCFKIHGKIFATLSLGGVPQKVCFKCTPESFSELVEREAIHPAPYVGRYKWVVLDRPDALPAHELQDFIRQSYEMIAAKASGPRKSNKNSKTAQKPATRTTDARAKPKTRLRRRNSTSRK